MKPLSILCAGLALAACAYDPPMQADHGAPHYVADLAHCQDAARAAADTAVKQRFHLFIIYPVSVPIERRVQTRICLESKGYKLADR